MKKKKICSLSISIWCCLRQISKRVFPRKQQLNFISQVATLPSRASSSPGSSSSAGTSSSSRRPFLEATGSTRKGDRMRLTSARTVRLSGDTHLKSLSSDCFVLLHKFLRELWHHLYRLTGRELSLLVESRIRGLAADSWLYLGR